VSELENFRLRVFRAVAEHLSFRKAAEQLLLTQPAVTLQIKALEEALGVRLFDRSARGISLTAQGELLLSYARQMAALASEAEKALGAAEGNLSGDLSIGASTTIAQYVLPWLLGAFLGENARIRVAIHSGNTSEIVQMILDGKASIGLIEGPSGSRAVRSEPFMEDELVLIVRPDFEFHRLSGQQLLANRLLIRERGSGSRQVVEMALAKAGLRLKAFRNVIDLDSTEAIKSGVEAGLGVGFVPRRAIAKELELHALMVANVTGVEATRQFTLVSRTGPEPQGAAGAFRRFVLDRAQIFSRRSKTNPIVRFNR
jgi:LysR family transcriptional regulator, transcriptional activator of the cysJI operon